MTAGIFRMVSPGLINHLGVLVMGAGMVGLAVQTGETLLALTFVALGCARGLLRITSATMIAGERAEERSRLGMASAVYNAGLDLGAVLGPPLAGMLASILGIPNAFTLLGLALPAVYYGVRLAARR